ncbi:MAG: RNA polymerase subunit sigma [Acidobacteria bacterium]|nr:MAG: RNA polymerase subunit sigma [Acidobacteriota bacterium]PYQ25291.1 MAG: RNA polymerase subunit sigma [Acidobacteriota bacterium]
MAAGDIALRPAEALAGGASLERGLVEECCRGDAQAFARLVALHEGMVFNLAARLLGDAEEARDLAQEVFLQVYRTLGRFEGRSTLKTWIYRIVVNQCRNRRRWWRRRRKDRSRSLETLTRSEEERLAEGSGRMEGPDERVERRERARAVQSALQRLSFGHRAVLLLREVEGLSCEEIAAALALPEGTVKSRLSRARESLRRALTDGKEAAP